MKKYFEVVSKKITIPSLKYTDGSGLDYIRTYVSNLGKSGYDFIQNVNDVIDINQPVVLFYGIEYLSSFFLNLHLNFTPENRYLSQIPLRKYRIHGISSHEFNDIPPNQKISTLLQKKIKLEKYGLAPRYFALCETPFEYFFINQFSFSLIELLNAFYRKLRIGIPREIQNGFLEDFKIELPTKRFNCFNLDILTFYLLVFIFSHLARYRINTWKRLLWEEDCNLGYYIRFVMKTIRKMYIRRVFSLISKYNDDLTLIRRRLKSKN